MSKQQADVVEAIWEHWVIHGDVPARRADQMRDELLQHFKDGKADGKQILDITGMDLRAFADEWAQFEEEPDRLAGVRIVGQTILGAACSLTLAHTIIKRSLNLSVPIVWGVAAVLVMASYAWFAFGPGGSRLRRRPLPESRLKIAAIAGLAGGTVFVAISALIAFIGVGPVLAVPRLLVAVIATAWGFLLLAFLLVTVGVSPIRLLRRVPPRP